MTEIRVELGDRSYPVRIGAGLLGEAAHHLAPLARGRRLAIVTDERVWAAQGPRLLAAIGPVTAAPIVVPAGEGAKRWPVLARLVDQLLGHGLERGEPIVAFGGGVIGDLAGFAAAILKRGVPYVQIPTTLLAQVDSSVGGKTGINTDAGKNLVGAFHQPALVLVDPDCLATLDPRQLRAGYAEIVKYALIEDASLFDWLEGNARFVLAREPAALHHALAASIAGKARIVAEDERETTGRRALLNLGHSFAHALEAETGYSDRLLHGEAVAIGLVLAFRVSARLGLCAGADAARVCDHLARLGLPTRPAQVGKISPDRLVTRMHGDKKNLAGRPTLILARGIGRAFVCRDLEWPQVERLLAECG